MQSCVNTAGRRNGGASKISHLIAARRRHDPPPRHGANRLAGKAKGRSPDGTAAPEGRVLPADGLD